MGNIIIIFQRVFPLLVFLFFQIISFYIISCYNDFHESKMISRSNHFSARYNESITNMTDFVNMPEYNEQLIHENAQLKQALYYANQQHNIYVSDSIMNHSKPTLPLSVQITNAKVVSNTIANLRNYIIVDKGTKDGIVKDMAVISNRGPIGIVVDVSENYASIMSILNKDANTSVRVRKTQNVGQLRWKGGSIRTASLEEIPKHIKLKKGDVIETSGYSSYYPEGIPVGIVEDYQEDNKSNFANIRIALFNDFTKLKYVYLIKNVEQPEIKKIEDSIAIIQKNTAND